MQIKKLGGYRIISTVGEAIPVNMSVEGIIRPGGRRGWLHASNGL